MNKRTLVFAGNERQARSWAQEAEAAAGEWAYVSSPDWLRGRRLAGVPRVFVGTFYERRDASEFDAVLRFLDAIEVRVPR